MESEESGVADSLGNIKGLNGNGLSQTCKTVITSAWVMLIGNVSLGLSLGAFRRIIISSFFKAHPGVVVMYEASFVAANENCETEIRGGFVGLTGYDNVLIQTDTLEVVKAIKESPSNGSNYALIRRIHQLLS
ncbi:hypothetical protein Goshw_012183 [Gossypium schwendimanii]|uniref:RNase H type-1 domain-containing protein n=1 Tax=Gossypium schwendimanii TaxID=34291 RepID=A0A7J9KSG4_GOSSC|nr:hypothetical protein [Gossypium schwendimanii]